VVTLPIAQEFYLSFVYDQVTFLHCFVYQFLEFLVGSMVNVLKLLAIIRYIKNIDPRSAYALHILSNRYEYGNINDIMTLLKRINTPALLLPYEQMCMQSLYHNNELIPEQHPNEQNPMFELLQGNHLTSQPT